MTEEEKQQIKDKILNKLKSTLPTINKEAFNKGYQDRMNKVVQYDGFHPDSTGLTYCPYTGWNEDSFSYYEGWRSAATKKYNDWLANKSKDDQPDFLMSPYI